MKHDGSENVLISFWLSHENLSESIFAQKKKGAACHGRPRPEKYVHDLVGIVILLIPIAIGMPPAAVFVPPAMVLIRAAFSSFMHVAPPMTGLPAIPAVILHDFMPVL